MKTMIPFLQNTQKTPSRKNMKKIVLGNILIAWQKKKSDKQKILKAEAKNNTLFIETKLRTQRTSHWKLTQKSTGISSKC